MSVVLPHRSIEHISKSKNPRKDIIDLMGDLKDVELMGDQVLLGIYFRPEMSKGGIILTQATVEEDAFQGKAGLVLKWGPNAFRDPEDGSLYEQHAKVGEWVVFKVGDAWSLSLKGYPCRMVRDTSIKMKIKDPSIVF